MKKTTEWKTSKNENVKVTVSLILKETINLDGDNVEVDCCKISDVTAKIDGHPDQRGLSHFTKQIKHPAGFMMVGSIGKLGIAQENMDKVDGIIAEFKQHPVWIAKQAKIVKNKKEIADTEAQRAANGYCYKCGSYCHGDCGFN